MVKQQTSTISKKKKKNSHSVNELFFYPELISLRLLLFWQCEQTDKKKIITFMLCYRRVELRFMVAAFTIYYGDFHFEFQYNSKPNRCENGMVRKQKN